MRLTDFFWAVQGMELHAGFRSLFIQLPGCNLSCSPCNTDWKRAKEISIAELAAYASMETSQFAIITGGEPLMSPDFDTVVAILTEKNFLVSAETNGTLNRRPNVYHYTVTPKRITNWKVEHDMLLAASEFRFLVDKLKFEFDAVEYFWKTETEDLCFERNEIAEASGQKLRSLTRPFFLIPEWPVQSEILGAIQCFLARNPWARLSVPPSLSGRFE